MRDAANYTNAGAAQGAEFASEDLKRLHGSSPSRHTGLHP
jgi:hypothetical protein